MTHESMYSSAWMSVSVVAMVGLLGGCDDEDGKVAALERQVSELTSQLAALQSEVNALSGGVSLTELRSDVDTLETSVAALDTDVVEVQSDVGTLETSMGTLETSVASQGTRLTRAEGTLTGHGTRLSTVESSVSALETTTEKMSAVEVEGKPAIVFEGVNVHIRNGTDEVTDNRTETTNGLGNLIIGYNESDSTHTRNGSHNLVVGTDHEYLSYAGIVAGSENTVKVPYASVLGGGGNTAGDPDADPPTGLYSVILGGEACTAIVDLGTVYGGSSTSCQTVP